MSRLAEAVVSNWALETSDAGTEQRLSEEAESVNANSDPKPQPLPLRRREGEPSLSRDVPPFVLRRGTVYGSWKLVAPLLYGLEPGDEGVFASALKDAVHGYGSDPRAALNSLLDSLVEIAQALNQTPVDQLDTSAIRLRDQLNQQVAQV